MAMVEEATPVATRLGLTPCRSLPQLARHGVVCFAGSYQGQTIVLATHGVDYAFGLNRVGPEMAVFVTDLLCAALPFLQVIVNAGTAGAVGPTHDSQSIRRKEHKKKKEERRNKEKEE